MKLLTEYKLAKKFFVKPKKQYYLGKEKYGTPYFFPRNYINTILHFSIVSDKKLLNFPHLKIKLKNKFLIVRIGYPIYFRKTSLGWKDKFQTPRFEWPPQFHIYFFGLQFSYWYERYNDDYWEQMLWYLYYCEEYMSGQRDIKKAEENWPWSRDKISTWNKSFIK